MNNSSYKKENKQSAKADKKQKPIHETAPSENDALVEERIAKRMARAGTCSRREAEKWIADGRVSVNGKVLETPAFKVNQKDRIEVDGQPLSATERTRLWLFHKPSGTVTTNRDPEGRKTIYELFPPELPRVMSVGRLDINTEGLLLMTNDGGLSRILELPATAWLRRYRVRVHGRVNQETLDTLKDGIAVDGILYGSIEATIDTEQGSNTWINVSLREGKNREIKNVLGHLGLEVTRLIRISFGPFQLGDLPTGSIREIRSKMLRDQLGERLIEQAGANFDAPIINLAPEVPRSASKVAQPKNTKRGKPAFTKNKRGVANEDNLARLTTRPSNKSGSPNRSSSDKSRRGSSGRSFKKR